jgi:hypothetical protein
MGIGEKRYKWQLLDLEWDFNGMLKIFANKTGLLFEKQPCSFYDFPDRLS